MSVPSYVTLTGPQTTVMPASFNIAASAAAGSVIQGSILAFGPQSPAVTAPQVPITEVWSIVDLYIIGTVTPDALLSIYINGYPQDINPDLNSLNLNNLTRWKLMQALKLPPASTWFTTVTLMAANGTSQQTYTVYFSVIRAPYLPGSSTSTSSTSTSSK